MLRNGFPMQADIGSGKAARGMADWLCLAASPVFAGMALLAQLDGSAAMICSTMGVSPLGGMVPMYLLMSLFHSPPWLKLVLGRRRGTMPS